MCTEGKAVRTAVMEGTEAVLDRFIRDMESGCPNDFLTLSWLKLIYNTSVLPADKFAKFIQAAYEFIKFECADITSEEGLGVIQDTLDKVEFILNDEDVHAEGPLFVPSNSEEENPLDGLNMDEFMEWLRSADFSEVENDGYSEEEYSED